MTSKADPPFPPDPVIDAYKPGIDMSLLRENLKLTPEQRIDNLQKLLEFAEELRESGKKAFPPKRAGEPGPAS